MVAFQKIFHKLPTVIGMIHVKPLPGTPLYKPGSFQTIVDQAKAETEIYLESGIDGLLVENMHDLPYMKRNVGPEITSALSVICEAVKTLAGNHVPCGVQVLAGCNKEALAVAKASRLEFIRAEGFVFAHVADEGVMQSDAGQLLRYRKMIDAEHVCIFTDVKKKHSSHSVTNDLSLAETVQAAEFFLADGIVITGRSTGDPASFDDFKQVKHATSLPVIVGSGITLSNVAQYISSNGIIVGSHFKMNGNWRNSLDRERVKAFMRLIESRRC